VFSTLHSNCILGVVRLLSQRTLLVVCLLVVSVVAFADILLSASAQSVLQATSTTTVTITTTTTRTSTTGTTTTLTSTTYSPYIFPTLTTTVTLTITSTVSWYGPSTPLVGLALLSRGSLWCFYLILPAAFLWVGSRRLILRNGRRWWRRNVWFS
jgi:low affinity Fe/Cu permease